MRYVFFVVFGFGVSCFVQAQDFGGLPGGLDWQVLRGDSVDLISTRAATPFARRALQLDEALISLRPLSLGPRIEAVDVVVQAQTVVPNGFVGLEPFRSYLFASPPQQQALVSTNPWVDALAIHEYRHVEQYANLRQGVTRLASYVFGDGGWSALLNMSTPDWFLEGDAVYAESALTYAGRGRTPAFTALQRALLRDGSKYSYMKALNGSFRSRVPDEYPLGYTMVSHGRHAYPDVWPEVLEHAGKYSSLFYPFSNRLKRLTGLSTRTFYQETYDSLALVYAAQRPVQPVEGRRLAAPAFAKTDVRQLARYTFPLPIGKSDVVAERRTQTRVRELVRFSPAGDVEPLFVLGVGVDGAYHANENGVVWSELRVNPRRPNENYSVVVHRDLGDGPARALRAGTRLFSPGLSSDGGTVIAVGGDTLVQLKAATGHVTARLATGASLLVAPRFVPGSTTDVVVVEKRAGFLALMRYDLSRPDALPVQLTPWSRHTLGTPFVTRTHVYFEASFSGIDNVYRVALTAPGEIEQLTDASIGAMQPALRDSLLYFVTVESDGEPVRVLPQSQWLRRPVTVVEPADLPQYQRLMEDAGAAAFRDQFYEKTFRAQPPVQDAQATEAEEAEPYRGLLRGFRLYTLQPLANRNEASLTVFGNNLLNELQTEITAGYNLNEQRGFGSFDVTVARTWPWIQVGAAVAERSTSFISVTDSVQVRRADFQERSIGLDAVAPLTFRRGVYTTTVTPSVGADYFRFQEGVAEAIGTDDGLFALDLSLRAQRLRRLAPKHIVPRDGQAMQLTYRRSVDGSDASQLVTRGTLFVPGLLPAHGIRLDAHLRLEAVTNPYQFADFFPYARGYAKTFNESAVTLSANYHLPLWYPDLGAAGIVYVRRLRANLWGDWTRLRLPATVVREPDYTIRSVGVDLVADLQLFNILNVPLGVRIPYLLDDNRFGADAAGLGEVQVLVALPF